MKNKVIDKFNEYKACEKDTWANRLTWMGCDGKCPKHTTSILRFNEETGLLSKFEGIYDVDTLFKMTDKLATEYTSWVESKSKYKKKEIDDMHNFFIGVIGEFFFYKLFVHVGRIISVTGEKLGLDSIYDFSYVSPTLKNEKDSGVDYYHLQLMNKAVLFGLYYWLQLLFF